uniref:Uncharacterized protein n=1 Tax=Avena sativa TaxID=4498 RepID=A0ACD5ZDE9_AVESA
MSRELTKAGSFSGGSRRPPLSSSHADDRGQASSTACLHKRVQKKRPKPKDPRKSDLHRNSRQRSLARRGTRTQVLRAERRGGSCWLASRAVKARGEKDTSKSMEAAAAARKSVCVTGAGGFIASWLVKLLLSKGQYAVRGTVRDPGDAKNAHLKVLQGAEERLQLVRADLLDYDSVASAIAGCEGVFHVACPVPSGRSTNPEAEIIAPAVTGTLNVLKACHEAKVKRVVMVSSGAAVGANPNWPKGKAFDEDSWSDEDHCRKNGDWYYLSKTLAEREAFAYAAKTGLDIVTVCPSLVIGPLMQSTVNSSSKVLLNYLKEMSGRYICNAPPITVSDMINLLKTLYPTYIYPKNFTEVEENIVFSSEKLHKLGWTLRPVGKTLGDSVESYKASGILN